MNALQASRRGFLGNLVILTAGVALGNKPGIIPDGNSSTNLEMLWKNFCRQQAGRSFSGVVKTKKEIIPCKGHQHQEGPMYFPKENIIAQPVWIHWACNKTRPSDVIVNFYQQDGGVVSINQFELKSLTQMALLPDKSQALDLTELLKVDGNGGGYMLCKQQLEPITAFPLQP
ncbi:hypothetical protein [Niabella hibiscisoli]|uniref:hypothetical protein n=1 Tax=Niabella hibiscisoli TaxID=1825928 RepID=UPI001F107A8B|nr:hypothetical protein [Niabella hibiscisoli]MCH5715921.1 hypothetical protein [Niabella hibiscisoli]